jgi:primosomal protein N' (replication factor Y) (superfamily II helicase)
MKVIRVGLDVPVDREFEYFAPDASADDIGRRTVVPFGRRMTLGVVLGVSDHSVFPAEKLKRVTRILRDSPAVPAEDLKLLRFAADYYHYPLGQVVMNALPVRLRKAESAGRAQEAEYVLTHLGRSQPPDAIPARARVKRRVRRRARPGGAHGGRSEKARADRTRRAARSRSRGLG